MTDHSRRTFLAGAGVAATAVTVTALTPTAALAAAPSDSGPVSSASLVAYVRDARSGHITIMSGDREIQITDKALARRLSRLAG
jgi:hypothetical protein